MSRPWRTVPPQPVSQVVTRQVSETVTCEDCILTTIALTPILELDAMREILKEAALAAGWTPDTCEPDKLVKAGNGSEQLLDLEELTVTTLAKTQAKVEKSSESLAVAIEQNMASEKAKVGKALEDKLKNEVAEQVVEVKAELEGKVSEKLAKDEPQRKKDLNELLKRVYAEALKRKAASLGDVTSVHENDEDGEYGLTIKIVE